MKAKKQHKQEASGERSTPLSVTKVTSRARYVVEFLPHRPEAKTQFLAINIIVDGKVYQSLLIDHSALDSVIEGLCEAQRMLADRDTPPDVVRLEEDWRKIVQDPQGSPPFDDGGNTITF